MLYQLKQKLLALQQLQGKDLYKAIGAIFAVFLIIGSLLGYINASKLNKNEQISSNNGTVDQNKQPAVVTYKGVVTFLGENAYPDDKISYSLENANGDDIILLRTDDEKLSIAQGLFVSVSGTKVKSLDGKNDILEVLEVTLKNGSN